MNEITDIVLRKTLINAVQVLTNAPEFKEGSVVTSETPWGINVVSSLKDGVFTFLYSIDEEKSKQFREDHLFLFKGPAAFTVNGLMAAWDGEFANYGYKCNKCDENPTGTEWIEFPFQFTVLKDELDRKEFIITTSDPAQTEHLNAYSEEDIKRINQI